MTPPFALDQTKVGVPCIVVSIEASPSVDQLRSLGLIEGAELELIRRVSGGTLLIFRIDEADIALRREVAATISVRDALREGSSY